MKRIVLLLSIMIFVLFFIFQSFSYELPSYKGWINDFANIIDNNYKQKLEFLITEVEQKTSSEISIVTIASLEGENLEDYTNRLFQKWGLGKKGKDNGVIVLLALSERKVRIEVGYGLEGILPDGLCGEIIRNYMLGFLKEGNYGAGIYNGTLAVSSIIAKNAGVVVSGTENISVVPAKKRSKFKSLIQLIFILIMIIIFIRHPFLALFLLSNSGFGRGFRGGGFGSGSGGFGGFGGGSSGGGGASGSW